MKRREGEGTERGRGGWRVRTIPHRHHYLYHLPSLVVEILNDPQPNSRLTLFYCYVTSVIVTSAFAVHYAASASGSASSSPSAFFQTKSIPALVCFSLPPSLSDLKVFQDKQEPISMVQYLSHPVSQSARCKTKKQALPSSNPSRITPTNSGLGI